MNLKYRIYDEKEKRYITDDAVWFMNINCALFTFQNSNNKLYTKNESDVIIEHSTCIRDMNDNEIFEGDILQYRNSKGEYELGYVYYDKGMGAFMIAQKIGSGEVNYSFDDINMQKLLIIGNINCNYELLERERMNYSEVKERQILEKMCEICEMGTRDSEDNFECLENIFPCSSIRETFEKVIEILEA